MTDLNLKFSESGQPVQSLPSSDVPKLLSHESGHVEAHRAIVVIAGTAPPRQEQAGPLLCPPLILGLILLQGSMPRQMPAGEMVVGEEGNNM